MSNAPAVNPGEKGSPLDMPAEGGQQSWFDFRPIESDTSDAQYGPLGRSRPSDPEGAPFAMESPASDALGRPRTQKSSATVPTEPVTASMPEEPDKGESTRTSSLTQLSDPSICAAPTDPSHYAPEQSPAASTERINICHGQELECLPRDTNGAESAVATRPIANPGITPQQKVEELMHDSALSLPTANDRFAPLLLGTSKHGRHKIRANTDAMQTLGSTEREIYQCLLDPENPNFLSFSDDARRESLTRRIGTRDLAHLIYVRREGEDMELRAHLEAADRAGELKVAQTKELENIKKSIKTARRSLADKYFIEMSEANAYTHAAITYHVYLPIEVLRRQHAHGCLCWRKGGNDSRILVDMHGRDISREVNDSCNGSIREETGRETNISNSAVQDSGKTSQGATQ